MHLHSHIINIMKYAMLKNIFAYLRDFTGICPLRSAERSVARVGVLFVVLMKFDQVFRNGVVYHMRNICGHCDTIHCVRCVCVWLCA